MTADAAEWITTQHVADLLSVRLDTLYGAMRDARAAIRHHVRSESAESARGCGWMWLRADVESIARIRSRGVSLRAALRAAPRIPNLDDS
jgi:hypothetical protein